MFPHLCRMQNIIAETHTPLINLFVMLIAKVVCIRLPAKMNILVANALKTVMCCPCH